MDFPVPDKQKNNKKVDSFNKYIGSAGAARSVQVIVCSVSQAVNNER